MSENNQTEERFEPQESLLISDLETLRTIADPLRVKILELALDQPRTVKQLAAMLKTPPTKLYYHINTLEQAGLLRVVGTRLVSGIVEKQYRVAARSIGVDPALLSPAQVAADVVLDLAISGVLDVARLDIRNMRRDFGEGPIDPGDKHPKNEVTVIRTLGRLSREEATEFRKQLHDLLQRFSVKEECGPEDESYSLTILMYPVQMTPPADDIANEE